MSLPEATRADARKDLATGAAVALLAAVVYAGSMSNGFVWDDVPVIAGNAVIRGEPAALFTGIDVARAGEANPYYRPLTLLSFLLEERLHGLTPGWMHLVNVLLHAGAVLLVHRLGRAVGLGRAGALVAALLLAVHPLASEAVEFLAGGRNTLLATVLALAALLLHRRSAGGARLPAALGGAACFLAGLLSKETALLVLPFVVATELGREDGRLRLRPGAPLRLAPYAVAAAAYAALRAAALSGAGVRVDVLDGLGARLLADLYVLPRHLEAVVWPRAVNLADPLPRDLSPLALPLLAAWVAIAAAVGYLVTRGRTPATLFGLAWFALFWLPVSGIVHIPSSPLGDRHLYLPAIGLWIVAGAQAERLLAGRHRRAIAVAAGAALALLAVETHGRHAVWASDVTLFERFVGDHPGSAFGHHNLGCAYLDVARDLDAAERELGAALALDPAFPRTRTQLGWVRLERGDLAGALQHYDAAIGLNPLDAEALLNRGTVFERLGMRDRAVADFERFLRTPGGELPEARRAVSMRLPMLQR